MMRSSIVPLEILCGVWGGFLQERAPIIPAIYLVLALCNKYTHFLMEASAEVMFFQVAKVELFYPSLLLNSHCGSVP